MPSDISAQLANTQPQHDFKAVPGPSPLTLDNLNQLNSADTAWLTSKVDITTNPAWLNGVKPDATGKTNDAVTAAIIVNDHGGGNVDAFYMYFYAYNYGGEVFGENLGNHVGDWYDSLELREPILSNCLQGAQYDSVQERGAGSGVVLATR
jgi:hypothetical protein